MLRSMTQFPMRDFFINTVVRCMAIMLISMSMSCAIALFFELGFLRFLLNIGVTELSLCILVYHVGVSKGERNYIKRKISVILYHR